MDDATLPRLLMENARRLGNRVALREKDFGIWQTVTWRQFADHVRAFAMGLYALGVRRGDVVAILGDNRLNGCTPNLLLNRLARCPSAYTRTRLPERFTIFSQRLKPE